MKLYLAYESSLELVRYLRSTGDGTIEGTPVRARTLRDAIRSDGQLDGLDSTAQRLLEHTGDQIHAFVSRREHVTKTSRLSTHLLSGSVPMGSFIDIGHDLLVSTPAFMFVQLATKLDFTELILVGLELCGHYSKWRLPPATFEEQQLSAREHKENRDTTFKLIPAARAQRISAYVERNNGMRGVSKARTALKWLLDESASPMESALYLLLCLPRARGGYGLPQPTLNPKVTISTTDGITERYPDLYWIARAIDVEYNSDDDHSGEWARYRDSRREVQLVTNKITVLPLTRVQLMNVDLFYEFADGLRKLLGERKRTTRFDWEARRAALRAVVLP